MSFHLQMILNFHGNYVAIALCPSSSAVSILISKLEDYFVESHHCEKGWFCNQIILRRESLLTTTGFVDSSYIQLHRL